MRKKWLIAGLLVVAVGAEGAALFLNREDGGAKPAAVATVAADTGEITTRVAATGTVQAAATRSLGFAVAGTVERVAVRPGARVRAGALLATVDDSDAADAVADARDVLAEAEDQLAAAKRTGTSSAARSGAAGAAETGAAKARSGAAEAKSGAAAGSGTAEVRSGGAEAGSRAAQAGAAQAGAAQARAGTAEAGAAQARAGTAEAGAARAQAAEARSGAAVAGAGAADGSAEVGARARVGGLDAILVAQQRVNQAVSALAAARVALGGTAITAPIAGTVMTVAGQVGSRVTAGSAFVTLADTDAMRVSAAVPEADAGRIEVGQQATVTLADRVGAEFGAEVEQVDPVGAADGALVTYGVLVSFVSQPADLMVGQSAAVEVRTGRVDAALRVPSTAVHDVRDGGGVVLVRSGNASVERKVTVGLRGDEYTEIHTGLEEGEMVVRSW